MLKKFLEILTGDRSGLQASIVRGSAAVFSIQVAGLLLVLALNVCLVRFLGPVEYGHYSFALSWVNILAVIGSMGWGTANIRLIPKLRVEGRVGELSGLVTSSMGLSIFAALLVGSIYVVVIPGFYSDVPSLFHVASGSLVVVVSVLLVVSGSIKGLKRVVAAQFINLIGRPFFMLLMVGTVGLGFSDHSAALTGILINLIATLIVVSFLLIYLLRYFNQNISGTPKQYYFRKWFGYSLPLVLITGFNVVNSRAGILTTGIYLSPEETGNYAACVQISLLAGFGLLVVGMVAQPILSELYSKNDIQQIKTTLKLTARGSIFLSIPIALFITITGKWLLGLMSESYVSAYPVLIVLTLGQLVSVISGQVGTLMVMADMQYSAMYILGTSIVLHIVLLLVLVPHLGIMGAGLSSVLTVVFWNISMAVVVWRKFGFRATAI